MINNNLVNYIRKLASVLKNRSYGIRQQKQLRLSKKYLFDENNDKIILVSHSSDKTGANILLKSMVKEIKNRNIDIVVLTREYGHIIPDYCKLAPTYVFFNTSKLNEILFKLKKQGFSKAIINTTVNGDIVEVFKKYNFTTVTLVHELPRVIHELRIEDRAIALGKNSDYVVFPSKYVYSKFIDLATISCEVKIKPQGLNLTEAHLSNKKNSRTILSSRYGENLKDKIVINVGYGNERKGYDLFLDMVNTCKSDNITFIWIGGYSRRLYQKCLNLMGVNDLPNLIQTGFIDKSEDLAIFYDAADIMTLTSREDPFPSVVLQAFNMYTPTIGFKNAGGFVDIIIDGETGYLVDYENIDLMLKRVEELLSKTNELEIISTKCKQLADNYKFEDYISYLVQLLNQGKSNIERKYI